MPAVYSYIRWSTDRQQDGSSEERQTQAIQRFCKHFKLEVVEEIADKGVSSLRGKNYHAGNLGKFIARAKDKLIPKGSILLFENVDRMTRMDTAQAAMLFLEILHAGIDIGIADDLKIYSVENLGTGEFMDILMEVKRANGESVRKRDFSIKGWNAKRSQQQQGKPITEKSPSWLKVESGEFVVLEDKVEQIKALFENTLIHGVAAAARLVNETYGSEYKIYQAQYLLKNRRLIGEHTLKLTGDNGKKTSAETYSGVYPTVIDPVLFDQVQQKAKSRKFYSGRYEKTHKNILSGLIRCEHCGGSVRYMHKGERQYFYCTPSMTRQCIIPGSLSVRAEPVKRSFINLDQFTNVREFLAEAAEQMKQVEREMIVLNSKLKPLKDRQVLFKQKMLGANEDQAEIYVDSLVQIKKEIRLIEDELEQKQDEYESAAIRAKAQIHTERIDWLLESDEEEAIKERQRLNRELKKLFAKVTIDFKNKVLYFRPKDGLYPTFPLAFHEGSVMPEEILPEPWEMEIEES